jgi:8-oxo-dGTP pyrophosphatase MutT (NUDIX family)
MNKTISAGVVVTDGKKILLCHVTGGKHWDLPKGKLDPDESHLDAAVRELREETSLQVDPINLEPLGMFKYKHNKDLSLFLYRVDTMPDTAVLDCLSTFDSGKGIHKKEMDGFANVHWEKISKRVVPDLLRVLQEVQGMLK